MANISKLQLLIHASFIITANKAKGQFFTVKIGFDLIDYGFTHNQLFDGCSKATDSDNVIAIQPKKKTAIIVLYH